MQLLKSTHMLSMMQQSLRRCFSLLYHSNAVSDGLAVRHGVHKFCMRALVPPQDFHDIQDSPPDLSVRFGLGELQSAEIEVTRYRAQFQGIEHKRSHMLHVRVELLAMRCNSSFLSGYIALPHYQMHVQAADLQSFQQAVQLL